MGRIRRNGGNMLSRRMREARKTNKMGRENVKKRTEMKEKET
jgi:hypothetical protein